MRKCTVAIGRQKSGFWIVGRILATTYLNTSSTWTATVVALGFGATSKGQPDQQQISKALQVLFS
jgi:hypothetical protein